MEQKNPYQLVLLRHGQSEWNKKNLFTGWRDVDLSEQGVVEAKEAGRVLRAQGFVFDIAFTSLLKRAIKTLWLTLEEMDLMWIPVENHWRLNERHYGALQGSDKAEAVRRFGEAQVKIWRRSYATPPPFVGTDSPDYPRTDPRYAALKASEIPRGESLKDVLARVLPYWEARIVPELKAGKCVLIAAHGNSLRALLKHLENVSEEKIVDLDIPTGIPRAYTLDANFRCIESHFVGDAAVIEKKIEAVKEETQRK